MIPDFNRGQHFLLNTGRIINEADISKNDRVIEIGAGNGNLTEEIAKKAGKILAFEIDERFREPLNKLKEKYSNIKIIYENSLKSDWRGYNKIIANLPFFISGDLIIKSTEDDIDEIVIIIGEKFKKILEKGESKAGIIANTFFDISYICRMEKKNFFPAPKVNSWLIKMKKKKIRKKEKILLDILKKQGKIKNAIIYSLAENGWTKKQAREFIDSSGISNEVLEKSAKKITGRFLIKLMKDLKKINQT
jgi:16S rRNA (adenine1518-N6/adenine1519-N6)-dimethyltransferase